MSLIGRIRYWLAKPYISQIWMNGYEVGLIAGRREKDEEYRHIAMTTTIKPIIGARERAKLAKFRRDNLGGKK